MGNKRNTGEGFRRIGIHCEDLRRAGSALREENACTVYAVAIAFGLSFNVAHKMMAKYGKREFRQGGRINEAMPIISGIMCAEHEHKYPGNYKKGSIGGISFGGFAKQNPVGIFILTSSTHAAACIDGIIYDNFNSKRYHLWSYHKITLAQDFEI